MATYIQLIQLTTSVFKLNSNYGTVMKTIKSILIVIAGIICFSSCADLDVKPRNMVSDDAVFNSAAGVEAYFAKLYRELPIEDFNYTASDGFNHRYGWQYRPNSGYTGEFISRDIDNCVYEKADMVWSWVYQNVRRINYFINNFEPYKDYFKEETYNHLIGEAYFLRAYSYYALAKRHGGVPYLTEVIDYPDCGYEGTFVERNSEEETWRMIGQDLDMAYNLMGSDKMAPERANRYTAAALKSKVMLTAGCIAKYNTIYHFHKGSDGAPNVQVCGIPADKADEFFKEALTAAKLVEGHASLYKKKFVAGDKEKIRDNLIQCFLDEDNPEILFVRRYNYTDTNHSYDKFMRNRMYPVDGIGSSGCPSLDFVEMFELYDMEGNSLKDENGEFICFDENGEYILWDDRNDPWKNCEPRLKAYVICPGDEFMGKPIDIRRGIYTGPWTPGEHSGIKPLRSKTTWSNYKTVANGGYIVDAGSADGSEKSPYEFEDGTKMTKCGLAGPFNENSESAHTGFSTRKFLVESRTEAAYENKMDQQWIDMRYAEVMLNRAEAEYELFLDGQPEGDLADAMIQINAIRERAGATLLTSVGELTLDVVRTERRKEMANENKIYWDFKRWRILDVLQNKTIYHTLMPFYVSTTSPTSAEGGKWFYDRREDQYHKQFSYNTRYYYHPIPSAEINRNPNLEQNPGF